MAVTVTLYDHFRYQLAKGQIDLSQAGRLKLAFLASNTAIVQNAGTMAATSGNAMYGATESSGYTRPALQTITVTEGSGATTLDAADVVVTDSAGTFQAYRAILYYDPTGSSADSACTPIAHILLDNTAGGTLQNPDTNGTLTVTWNASGILAI